MFRLSWRLASGQFGGDTYESREDAIDDWHRLVMRPDVARVCVHEGGGLGAWALLTWASDGTVFEAVEELQGSRDDVAA